jgi:hypothetical protein
MIAAWVQIINVAFRRRTRESKCSLTPLRLTLLMAVVGHPAARRVSSLNIS